MLNSLSFLIIYMTSYALTLLNEIKQIFPNSYNYITQTLTIEYIFIKD